MSPDRWRALAACLALHACTENTAAPADATADRAALDAAADAAKKDPDDVPLDRPVPPDVARDAGDEARAAERERCAYGPGSFAVETVGAEVPIGSQMPIDHILIVMQENRSFDHYFRTLPQSGQADVDVATDAWSNPAASGAAVTFHHDTERCIVDTEHGWAAVHRQYHDGMMDGFVATNEPHGERALTYFDQSDIPFYHALATTFGLGDRYFCSVLGPTWPNRMYLMAGTSFGLAHNTFVLGDQRATPVQHIFRRLDDAGVTWKDYGNGIRMLQFFPYYGIVRAETRARLASLDDLQRDLAAGTLPQVAFIEPSYLGTGGDRVDEHPPGIPMNGERHVEAVVRGLMASPLWSRSALFITYDEHGGFADHVPPPSACEPDAMTPTIDRMPVDGRFDRYGIRVPFMVVSPYARRHFVSHRVFDHTSILRFVEARFDLPALTRRDANAAIPTDFFDFEHPPFMTPPTLPHAGVVDAATVERCTRLFPSASGL